MFDCTVWKIYYSGPSLLRPFVRNCGHIREVAFGERLIVVGAKIYGHIREGGLW